MDLIDNFDFFINHSLSYINPIKPYEIKFYHLVLVLKGSCTYIVNGEKVKLEENDALLLVPGTHRERYSTSSYIHIVILNFFTNNPKLSTNHFFKNGINQTIKRLLDIYPYKAYQDIGTQNKDSDENYKLKVAIQNVFECILLELLESLKYSTRNPHILNALKYINDNITHPLSLNDVSKITHLSKEYTSRLFKKEIGMTVSEYINNKKLALAKDMLANKDITIQEISRALGYENYTYFTKIFKEMHHISPQKMRNEIKYIN